MPGWLPVLLCLALSACLPRSDKPEMACASSYLEAAAQDVLNRPVKLLKLVEPGTCPGHFDIRPSQAAALRQCPLLVRFDFQNSLDRYLETTDGRPTQVVEVVLHGGLCVPSNYLAACHQIASHLAAHAQGAPQDFKPRLQAIQNRLAALEYLLRRQIREAGLEGAPVVASRRQRDFCAWLGLRVVADFSGADVARPAELERAVAEGRSAGARLVIANLPEGRKAADFIADALKARVVVFGNFPVPVAEGPEFDALLQENVRLLAVQARQP